MLEYRNVDIGYHKKTLLKGISVKFPKGCITSVIGPNGCGKTTMLQCLIGSSKVQAGHVFLDDRDYFSKLPKDRAKALAFLPQVRYVIPMLPVRVMVGHGRFPHMGYSRKESPKDIEAIMAAMEYTNITEYAHTPVDTLSGGMRQRVFLAMVLAQDTPYIILDEPTTYLDINGQKEFLHLIKGLKERGKTIIMVLHDINQALEASDYIAIMKEQRIHFFGTPEMCTKCNAVEEAFQVACEKFEKNHRTYYFF